MPSELCIDHPNEDTKLKFHQCDTVWYDMDSIPVSFNATEFLSFALARCVESKIPCNTGLVSPCLTKGTGTSAVIHKASAMPGSTGPGGFNTSYITDRRRWTARTNYPSRIRQQLSYNCTLSESAPQLCRALQVLGITLLPFTKQNFVSSREKVIVSECQRLGQRSGVS